MTYNDYTLATLNVLLAHPTGLDIRSIEREVAGVLKLSDEEIDAPSKNDPRTEFQYRLAWVRTRLKNDGLILNISRGFWKLSPKALSEFKTAAATEMVRPPRIAEPLPGMDWTAEVDTGLLAPSPPITPLTAAEKEELGSLLPLVIEAARNLVELLRQSRSNSAQRIAPIAEKYLSIVSQDIGFLSIDAMFAAGVRLRNAQHRLAGEVLNEGFPDLSAEIGEAFDSTVGLHGPCLLSTARGNELARRAREDTRTRSDELAFKAQAEEFAVRLRQARSLVTSAGKDLVEQVIADAGSGPQPERSILVAEATTQTLLVRIAKVVISEIGKESFKASIYGAAAIGVGIVSLNSSVDFLLSNSASLKLLAAATGESLSWLPQFLNWMEVERGRIWLRATGK